MEDFISPSGEQLTVSQSQFRNDSKFCGIGKFVAVLSILENPQDSDVFVP